MRKKIPELHYRSSRICRVLGNPTAYEMLKILANSKMRPSEIASEFGLTLPTICATLRSLRQLDLVRYEARNNGKFYFIKDEKILSVMHEIEQLVELIRTREYQ
jgi:DNA-binding transcriptional ArsR family regulator